MPASIAEVVALYQTNARVSAADERELNGFRPELSMLPTPKEFQSVVEELNSLAACDLRFREELWNANLGPDDLKEFDRMIETASGHPASIAPSRLCLSQPLRDWRIAPRSPSTARRIRFSSAFAPVSGRVDSRNADQKKPKR
jgi:hypothetical protein